jgi:hypothetical protein
LVTTSEEREKLKQLKIEARKRDDWKACKALRNKIFEYDRAHPDEPSLALEVAKATHGI